MTNSPPHHLAAQVTQEALAAVFDPSAVAALREDSPLSALGFADADMVCVVDALAAAASARGRSCVLEDADVVEVTSVADLIGAVMTALDEPEVSS
jgi:hypothetical protein